MERAISSSNVVMRLERQEADATLDAEGLDKPFQFAPIRAVADNADRDARQVLHCSNEHLDALVRLKSPDVAHLQRDLRKRHGRWAEPFDIDTEPDHRNITGKTLPAKDLTRVVVAHVRPSGAAKRRPLDPTKRQRKALLDVLRSVEGDRRLLSRQAKKQTHFQCGETRRLLMNVDDLRAMCPQRPPDRPRVVQEHVRMTTDRACTAHEPLIVGRAKRHVAPAFVPALGADQPQVDPESSQRPVAASKPGDNPRVVDAQNPQAGGTRHPSTTSR